MKCPCKGCNKRTITCHGEREDYKEWFIENRKVQERERAERSRSYALEKQIPRRNYFS